MIKSATSTAIYDLVKAISNSRTEFEPLDNKEVLIKNGIHFKDIGQIDKYDKGVKAMTWKTETFVKADVLWTNFEKYIERLNLKSQIIDACIKEMKSEFQLNDDDVYNKLLALIHFILYQDESNLNESRIAEIVTIFINDLGPSEPQWKIKLWIDGIWLADDVQVVVSDEVLIRRPDNSDFIVIRPYYSPGNFGAPEHVSCEAIIEIKRRFHQRTVESYLNKLIQSLRLYNLGSIEIKRREYLLNSILHRPFGIPFSLETHSPFNYRVEAHESNDLKLFLELMIGFLPNQNWENQITPLNSIYISIERYFAALTKPLAIEDVITTTITAFEALLLKVNERSELSHKLSQRVAYLSKYFNDQPIKVYSMMKKAYDVRSTYIHGSMLPPEQRKDFVSIRDQALGMLRKSLLTFIDLSNKHEKDAIIAKIDNAIIDNNAHQKLVSEISTSTLLKLTANSTGFSYNRPS